MTSIHSSIHPSIHPSRKAKRIVQVSSLCLVENKLEGKAFIHSFTPPSIHSSIHPSIWKAKRHSKCQRTSARSSGPSKHPMLLLYYKLHNCHNYVRKQQYWLTQVQSVLSLTYQAIIICIIISLSEGLCSSTMASLTFQCQNNYFIILKNPLSKYKIFPDYY